MFWRWRWASRSSTSRRGVRVARRDSVGDTRRQDDREGTRILPGSLRRPAPRRDDRTDVGRGGRRPRRLPGARLPAPANTLDLRADGRAGRALRPRSDRRRRAEGRPGRHLGAERGRVGGSAVRHGARRGDHGQHQSVLPGARAGVRAAPVGLHDADPGAGLQEHRLPRAASGRRGARSDSFNRAG